MEYTDVTEVSALLISVLLSNKDPIPLAKIENEYRQAIGEGIPYRALGFVDLEGFLRSIPDVVRLLRTGGGQLICEAVKSQNCTAHIANFVERQKGSKGARSSRFSGGRASVSQPSSRQSSSSLTRPAGRGQFRSSTTEHNRPSYTQSSRSQSRPSQSQSSYSERRPLRPEVAPRFRDRFSDRAPFVQRSVQLEGDNLTITIARNEVPDQFEFTIAASDPPPRRTMTSPVTNGGTVPPTDVPSSAESASSDGSRTIGDMKRELEELVGNDDTITFLPFVVNTGVFGLVKIGNVTYSSYPVEKRCAEDALAIAISNALEDLKNKPNIVDSDVSVTSSVPCIQRRLLQVLDVKPSGLFMNHVETSYEEMFHERLPLNWDVFLKDNWFQIDEVLGGNAILYGKVRSQDFVEVQYSNESSNRTKPSDDTSESGNLISLDEVLNVVVTVVNSTTDIWVRPATNWNAYDELATSMELHYLRSNDKARLERARNIVVGDVYATEADASCSRVKILHILPDEEVMCLFVDHGEINKISCNNLWILEPQFKAPNFKAIQCQLHGLEGFSGCDSQVLFRIVGKTFPAKVVSRENELHSIILYDTTSDEDLNVNEELRKLLLKEVRPPQLKSAGLGLNTTKDVYLCHVVDTGYVFLQIHSVTFELLENLVDTAAKSAHNSGVSSVSQNTVYLAKHSDALWYRVVCLSGSVPDEEDMVEVFFVDYGNTDRVSLTDMMSLQGDNEMLAQLPYQAIRCRLHNVPICDDIEWTKKASERLVLLAPDDLPLIAKVIPDQRKNEFPHVELFKRIEGKIELVSINESLNYDEGLFAKRQRYSVGKTVEAKKATEQCSSSRGASSATVLAPTSNRPDSPKRNITPVPFPSVGEEFDVYVTLASNPSNFIVQKWINGIQLDKLLLDMNDFYETKGRSVRANEAVNNALYALKCKDVWYRVRIKYNGVTDLVSANLIDYGDHEIASLDSLRILEDKFRILPSQIMRAKLSDIEPIHGDWLPEDSVLFRELVQEKNFVAIVVGENKLDDDDTDQKQLIVKLVDTSGAEDIYVHQTLIGKGIARLQDRS